MLSKQTAIFSCSEIFVITSAEGVSTVTPICKNLEIMIRAIVFLERASLPISSAEHLIKCLIKTYKVLATLTKHVSIVGNVNREFGEKLI